MALHRREEPPTSHTSPKRRMDRIRARNRDDLPISPTDDRERSSNGGQYRERKKMDPEGVHASLQGHHIDKYGVPRELPSAKSDDDRNRSKSKGSGSRYLDDRHGSFPSSDRTVPRVVHKRSKSKESESREGSRSRSSHKERSISGREEVQNHQSCSTGLMSSVRRKCMSDLERSRQCLSTNATYSIKDKESEGLALRAPGALHSFLAEGKGSSPRQGRDERSAVSSVSKIQRRKSKSIPPSGAASMFGGQVIDNRAEWRERRRTRSSLQFPLGDGTEMAAYGRDGRKERQSSTRSKTPSARRRQTIRRPSRDEHGERSPHSDEPRTSRSASQRELKVALTTGSEAPPGISALAVVNKKGIEIMGRGVDHTVVETPNNIKERQERRERMIQLTASNRCLGDVDGFLSVRKKQSLHKSSSGVDLNPGDESGGGGSLSPCLDGFLDRISPIQARRPSSGNRPITAASHADKQRKQCTSSRKEAKDPEPSAPLPTPSLYVPKRDDLLATVIDMPTCEERFDDITGYCNLGNDSQASIASLDPSILTKRNAPCTKISSLQELSYHSGGKDEGIEGELELNDSTTPSTQASSIELYSVSQCSSVVLCDIEQHSRSSCPGTISSPCSSSLSGTSDSPLHQGILKRHNGESPAESPSNRSRRVSWVELPLASPGMILVKSTDTDGTNESEAMTMADSFSTIDDFNADGEKKNTEASTRSPSLGATLENDTGDKKHHSADERTVGTTNTNTSESTTKTDNKTGIVPTSRKSKKQVPARRSGTLETSARSSRSSFTSKDDLLVDHAISHSHTSKTDDNGNLSEPQLLKSRRSGTHLKLFSSDDIKDELPAGMNCKRSRQTDSFTLEVDCPKAGFRVMSCKNGEHQSPGEPSAATSRRGSHTKPAPETTPGSSTKSYLNRRNMVKQHKERSQIARSSVMNSLDSFLARMGGLEETEHVDDRSVKSDRLHKKRVVVAITRSISDSCDRSVSSAPMLKNRRKRGVAMKVRRILADMAHVNDDTGVQ